MDKHIATALAVIVVLGTFFGTSFFIQNPEASSETDLAFPKIPAFGAVTPEIVLPSLDEAAISAQAWDIFERYREYADDRNLDGIRSVSHQLSETCENPGTRDECNELMDSVVLAARGFDREDFTKLAYDERQAVLYTDYIEENDGPIQRVLIFTRAEGEMRLLGIRFCEGSTMLPDALGLSCINVNPETRDADADGWWEDVEALFK